jgi:chorismate dehydratase
VTRQPEIRIGAVSYLNTKPLVYGLAERLPGAEISYEVPSRLADRLASGELDVALIPSVEFFQHPEYEIVSDACIGCRGPVRSVKLLSRVPLEGIRTLALDEGSRTSVALVRILLKERFGLRPELAPLPIASGAGCQPIPLEADAMLLIGDRAIHSPAGQWNTVWDLGEEWNRWAELSFVFAMWTARPGLDRALLAEVDAAFRAARDDGLAHLPQIAEREAAPIGLTARECLSYLRDNLYFYLGQREQAGLDLFYRHAAALGLAPNGRRWQPVESSAA